MKSRILQCLCCFAAFFSTFLFTRVFLKSNDNASPSVLEDGKNKRESIARAHIGASASEHKSTAQKGRENARKNYESTLRGGGTPKDVALALQVALTKNVNVAFAALRKMTVSQRAQLPSEVIELSFQNDPAQAQEIFAPVLQTTGPGRDSVLVWSSHFSLPTCLEMLGSSKGMLPEDSVRSLERAIQIPKDIDISQISVALGNISSLALRERIVYAICTKAAKEHPTVTRALMPHIFNDSKRADVEALLKAP